MDVRQPSIGQRAQALVIILLILAFVAVAQQFSFVVYQWGFVFLILVTISQIAVGNMRPGGQWRDIIRSMGITVGTVVLLTVLGIIVAPYLVLMGRG